MKQSCCEKHSPQQNGTLTHPSLVRDAITLISIKGPFVSHGCYAWKASPAVVTVYKNLIRKVFNLAGVQAELSDPSTTDYVCYGNLSYRLQEQGESSAGFDSSANRINTTTSFKSCIRRPHALSCWYSFKTPGFLYGFKR
ncbi:hypothetical protein FOWG_08255 [Fusarium oxysporum f. sp. lycopersici MN25]|uniref:Uncharacterized protein n=1 Tax=Fusarium oxysporum Fo47 TaxID=660027 RepID=W9K1Q3_FUSOX|nr:hypothetical protein FOZG_10651 [Fusarium oxysporum Fo47]EWZ90659.1 hypothetical protein FOWG_08255 [Fusarium oxysporum f. sp. lycopersici MN25]